MVLGYPTLVRQRLKMPNSPKIVDLLDVGSSESMAIKSNLGDRKV